MVESGRISLEGLMAHLGAYCMQRNVVPLDPAARYELKEAGVHYVIDEMLLSADEKINLKRVMSRRICLEQALVVQLIPAAYLCRVIEGFPSDLQASEIVQQFYLPAGLLPVLPGTSQYPCSVKVGEAFPSIAVRKEQIRAVVRAGINLTTGELNPILNTGARIDVFNYGGEQLRSYLDQSLAPGNTA